MSATALVWEILNTFHTLGGAKNGDEDRRNLQPTVEANVHNALSAVRHVTMRRSSARALTDSQELFITHSTAMSRCLQQAGGLGGGQHVRVDAVDLRLCEQRLADLQLVVRLQRPNTTM